MRQLVVLIRGSDGSKSMAVGLSGPLAETGQRVRPLQPLKLPLPRMVRVASCR